MIDLTYTLHNDLEYQEIQSKIADLEIKELRENQRFDYEIGELEEQLNNRVQYLKDNK